MPDINETVDCLFAGNDCKQGIVLVAYYNCEEKAPEQPCHMDYHKYADGAGLCYYRENYKLVAKVQDYCEIACEKP